MVDLIAPISDRLTSPKPLLQNSPMATVGPTSFGPSPYGPTPFVPLWQYKHRAAWLYPPA